jgi:hypothetical protein
MYSYQLLMTLEVETSSGSGSVCLAELVGWLGASLVTTAWRADGGNGLQLWRVAASTLNKHPLTADKGLSSSFVLDLGLTTPRHTNSMLRTVYMSIFSINNSYI